MIHIVEPIWLGAQVLLAMQLGWAGEEWMPHSVSMPEPSAFGVFDSSSSLLGGKNTTRGAVVASYHTNLPTYATLFGFPWLEPVSP